MTLAVPIFDTFGDVQMVLQTPGMVDRVARDEAKIAAEILRTGERLNGVFGVSSDPPAETSDARLTPPARNEARPAHRQLALTGGRCATVIYSDDRTSFYRENGDSVTCPSRSLDHERAFPMPRRIVDLSREIYHMMPVANPHINQVPAFWDRLTHATTKGRWESDISFHIRDFLIGEHVGTHVDALCHYDPRPARRASTRCRSRRS